MGKMDYVKRQLDNYMLNVTKVKNLDIEIEILKEDYQGTGSIDYSKERSGPTNKITSVVEMEAISREEKIELLEKARRKWAIEVERVDNWLDMLNPLDQEIIRLRHFKGLVWNDIESKVNMTREHAQLRRRRALEKICQVDL